MIDLKIGARDGSPSVRVAGGRCSSSDRSCWYWRQVHGGQFGAPWYTRQGGSRAPARALVRLTISERPPEDVLISPRRVVYFMTGPARSAELSGTLSASYHHDSPIPNNCVLGVNIGGVGTR